MARRTQTFAGPTPADGTQVTFNHAFANYGPVTITVTATDANGQVTGTLNETVTPIAPQIQNLAATTVNEGQQTVLTGDIVSPNTQDPYTLNVNWGDGQSSVGKPCGRRNLIRDRPHLSRRERAREHFHRVGQCDGYQRQPVVGPGHDTGDGQ